MPALLLQKPSRKSKACGHLIALGRRLKLWVEGTINESLYESKGIQERLPSTNTPINFQKISMEFKHVMQKETFNETLKLLTNNVINRTLPLTDQTLHLLLTKYPGNIRKKKRRPDVDSVFNHIAKSSATNIDRGIVESTLTELINQKIISNKKTSSGRDSLYRSQKSANN